MRRAAKLMANLLDDFHVPEVVALSRLDDMRATSGRLGHHHVRNQLRAPVAEAGTEGISVAQVGERDPQDVRPRLK